MNGDMGTREVVRRARNSFRRANRAFARVCWTAHEYPAYCLARTVVAALDDKEGWVLSYIAPGLSTADVARARQVLRANAQDLAAWADLRRRERVEVRDRAAKRLAEAGARLVLAQRARLDFLAALDPTEACRSMTYAELGRTQRQECAYHIYSVAMKQRGEIAQIYPTRPRGQYARWRKSGAVEIERRRLEKLESRAKDGSP